MSTKTFAPEASDLESDRKWYHIDASGKVLGRLATQVAVLLMGKGKRVYTPAMDCGDFVVVTNASRVKLTGNKLEQKFYFRHSGYAGGAKVIPVKRQMEQDSTKVVRLAVRRMLDDNRLRDKRLRRLKIYSQAAHEFDGRKMETPRG